MAKALGSDPGPGELQEVRLTKLMEEDEWDNRDAPARHNKTGHDLRPGAEFRPVDLPSSRAAAWRSLDNIGQSEAVLRKTAMDIELRLLIARIAEILGGVRTRLIAQANTYLQQIRSTGGNQNHGYHQQNMAYAEAQKQGKAVRVLAQLYNMCRAKILNLAYDTSVEGTARANDLRNRYRPLVADDLKCSTATYSTRGTASKGFSLPWFWRMVPIDLRESDAETRERDEQFVAECTFSFLHARIAAQLTNTLSLQNQMDQRQVCSDTLHRGADHSSL